MGECTYNTDHGRFLLRKEKTPYAFKALKKWAVETISLDPSTETDLSGLLGLFGIAAYENDKGDIIDVFLRDSYFNRTIQKILTEVIAPFVEPGSYIVFYGGGSSGCWGITWEKDHDTDKVVGDESDFVTVSRADLERMLTGLARESVYAEMKKKYGPVGEVPDDVAS